jgi:LacI family transcriptional regulator
MGVTTKEIADICGVSRGSVDRALNNRPGINEETKKMIMMTAEKLGYQPNLVARSLVKGKTMTLGVVVFELSNRFFTQLLVAIEAKARDYGYFVYLTSANTNPDEELECIEQLMSRQIDGLILYSVNRGESFNQYLKNLKIPVITISNRVSEDWPFIGLDDKQTIIDAVNYLFGKGYTRTIYVTPPMAHKDQMNMYSLEQRILGYQEAYKSRSNSGNPIIIEGPNYKKITAEINKIGDQKIAVLCANDLCALEVKDFLNNEGFKIPIDIGIMGFDNIDVLKFISPPLTTINYPIEEMGKLAVDFVIKAINGEDVPLIHILENDIIEGATI